MSLRGRRGQHTCFWLELQEPPGLCSVLEKVGCDTFGGNRCPHFELDRVSLTSFERLIRLLHDGRWIQRLHGGCWFVLKNTLTWGSFPFFSGQKHFPKFDYLFSNKDQEDFSNGLGTGPSHVHVKISRYLLPGLCGEGISEWVELWIRDKLPNSSVLLLSSSWIDSLWAFWCQRRGISSVSEWLFVPVFVYYCVIHPPSGVPGCCWTHKNQKLIFLLPPIRWWVS